MRLKNLTKIYLIESQSINDINSGRTEVAALSEMLKLTGVSNLVFSPQNLQSLKKCFSEIAKDAKPNQGEYAVIHIHFSMHGSELGIELTSEQTITWKEFYEILKPFNDKLGYVPHPAFKLAPIILTFSVCKGSYAKQMLSYCPQNESPFYYLIGPNCDVEWVDSLVAFTVFYHNTLQKNAPPDKAVHQMNNSAQLVDAFQLVTGNGVGKI